MILFYRFFSVITLVLLLATSACKKDKPSIEISYCNGGMMPDTVTFTETNIAGGNYLWQVFDEDGTSVSGPVNTSTMNSVFARLDNAGTYTVRVNVDDLSADQSFTMKSVVTDGEPRAVSFFDDFQTLWTVYPDSECHAAVRVKQVAGIGGIDYYLAENKIYYVAGNSLLSCFPNGEDLEELNGQGFSDITIVQSTGRVFISTFGGEILETTIPNLSNAVTNDQYDVRHQVNNSIEQLAFSPTENAFYSANGSSAIAVFEIEGSNEFESQFGSNLAKSAVAYDVENDLLYIAENSTTCVIVAIDLSQQGQRVAEYQVPCEGNIHGIDIDEDTGDVVYSDGENVWIFSTTNPTVVTPLVANFNRTIRQGELSFEESVEPPIGDVVIARYKD